MRRKAHVAAESYAGDLDNATPSEQMQLLASSKTSLMELHAGKLRPYAPETVEKVRRRIRRRCRLGLPHRDCLVAKGCSCGSLATALDELPEKVDVGEGVPHQATDLTAEHVRPVVLGGTDRDGLVVLCRCCNSLARCQSWQRAQRSSAMRPTSHERQSRFRRIQPC
jgi:hypothetical protein